MPYGTGLGLYPYGEVGSDENDEVSSTYEGRHLTVLGTEITTEMAGHSLQQSKHPMMVGENVVGVALTTETATGRTRYVTFDTEGLFLLSVVATNQLGDSAVVAGDELFINKTDGIISKNFDVTTHARFGVALGGVTTGDTAIITVKVHFDPDDEGFYARVGGEDGTDRTTVRSVFAFMRFSGVQTTGGGWQLINGLSGLVEVTGTLYGSTTFVCGLYGQVYGAGTLTEVSHICAIWGDYAVASGVPTTGSSEILYLTCNVADALLSSAIHIKLFPDEDCNGAEAMFYFEDCYFGGAAGTPIQDGGTGNSALNTGTKWLKMKVSVDGNIYYIVLMENPTE